MAKKSKIATKAVAWTADTPTKYQSSIELQVSSSRIIRISGDPKPTQSEAYKSLKAEYHLWQTALAAFGEELFAK